MVCATKIQINKNKSEYIIKLIGVYIRQKCFLTANIISTKMGNINWDKFRINYINVNHLVQLYDVSDRLTHVRSAPSIYLDSVSEPHPHDSSALWGYHWSLPVCLPMPLFETGWLGCWFHSRSSSLELWRYQVLHLSVLTQGWRGWVITVQFNLSHRLDASQAPSSLFCGFRLSVSVISCFSFFFCSIPSLLLAMRAL